MRIDPLLSTTKPGKVPWEWVPSDFPSFVQELSHIASHCKEIDHLALYRGHRERDWLLDSTFVRYVKEHIFGIDPTSIVRRDYRHSTSYQRLMGELFLFKFGTSTAPHKDLMDLAKVESLDSWFEYMKRIQQYPKEDLGTLRGSFLIDWSQRPETGKIILGSGGLRKIRWKSGGSGKRGGFRLIYFWDVPKDTIYMLLIYKKSKQEDLTQNQLKTLRNILKELLK